MVAAVRPFSTKFDIVANMSSGDFSIDAIDLEDEAVVASCTRDGSSKDEHDTQKPTVTKCKTLNPFCMESYLYANAPSQGMNASMSSLSFGASYASLGNSFASLCPTRWDSEHTGQHSAETNKALSPPRRLERSPAASSSMQKFRLPSRSKSFESLSQGSLPRIALLDASASAAVEMKQAAVNAFATAPRLRPVIKSMPNRRVFRTASLNSNKHPTLHETEPVLADSFATFASSFNSLGDSATSFALDEASTVVTYTSAADSKSMASSIDGTTFSAETFDADSLCFAIMSRRSSRDTNVSDDEDTSSGSLSPHAKKALYGIERCTDSLVDDDYSVDQGTSVMNNQSTAVDSTLSPPTLPCRKASKDDEKNVENFPHSVNEKHSSRFPLRLIALGSEDCVIVQKEEQATQATSTLTPPRLPLRQETVVADDKKEFPVKAKAEALPVISTAAAAAAAAAVPPQIPLRQLTAPYMEKADEVSNGRLLNESIAILPQQNTLNSKDDFKKGQPDPPRLPVRHETLFEGKEEKEVRNEESPYSIKKFHEDFNAVLAAGPPRFPSRQKTLQDEEKGEETTADVQSQAEVVGLDSMPRFPCRQKTLFQEDSTIPARNAVKEESSLSSPPRLPVRQTTLFRSNDEEDATAKKLTSPSFEWNVSVDSMALVPSHLHNPLVSRNCDSTIHSMQSSATTASVEPPRFPVRQATLCQTTNGVEDNKNSSSN